MLVLSRREHDDRSLPLPLHASPPLLVSECRLGDKLACGLEDRRAVRHLAPAPGSPISCPQRLLPRASASFCPRVTAAVPSPSPETGRLSRAGELGVHSTSMHIELAYVSGHLPERGAVAHCFLSFFASRSESCMICFSPIQSDCMFRKKTQTEQHRGII